MSKSFLDDAKEAINPAERFISQTSGQQPATTYRVNPQYGETKSRRLQLLIKPSLHSKLKSRADKEQKSINDLIHSILEKEVEE